MPARWPGILFVLLGLLCLPAAAWAGAPGVKDDAGFFSDAATASATQALQQIQQQFRHTVNVETFEKAPPEVASKGASAYAKTRIFALGTDVYVLITKSPGHVEVATREDVARSGLTDAGRDRLSQELLDGFKAKDYDGALKRMVEGLKKTYSAGAPEPGQQGTSPNPAGKSSNDTSAPLPAPHNSNSPTGSGSGSPTTGLFGGIGCFSIVIILVVLFVVISLVRRLFGGSRGNVPPPGYGQTGPGPGGYGQGGYGQGGYGQPGGGFGRGVAGGLLGGLLGGWLGNQTFGQGHHDSGNTGNAAGGEGGASSDPGGVGTSGGDFGDSGSSGNDFGGGSDAGSSGGDFGGGDSGGGGDAGSSGGDF